MLAGTKHGGLSGDHRVVDLLHVAKVDAWNAISLEELLLDLFVKVKRGFLEFLNGTEVGEVLHIEGGLVFSELFYEVLEGLEVSGQIPEKLRVTCGFFQELDGFCSAVLLHH